MTKDYDLPFPSATSTPHTTERAWRTANENLVLLTEVGSTLHGDVVRDIVMGLLGVPCGDARGLAWAEG